MSPLDRLRVAAPCLVSWDAMTGTHRVRHCDACGLNVYDLSNMRSAEALALVARTEGRLCARLWRRKDGTVITADCPLGVRERLGKILSGLAALAVVTLGGFAFARSEPGRRLVEKVSSIAQRVSSILDGCDREHIDVPERTMGVIVPADPRSDPPQTK